LPIDQSSSTKEFHFFNVNKKKVKVYYNDILYIESLKDYSRIVTTEGSLVTKGQIGELESFFTSKNFLRIHRSFIVSLDKINSYTASEIEINGKTLPIGRSYKVIVTQALNEFMVD
jgi:DNA-binding LytR/AlgR family response regulator